MAIAVSQLVQKIVVEGDTQAKSKLSEMHDAAEQTSGGFKGLLANSLAIAGGLGIFDLAGKAVGFLKDQLGDCLQESMDAQAGLAQTEAVIKSTGGAAGMTADQIVEMAGNLSHLTTFSDDAIQSGENMLLTFTNIGQDVFPQATKSLLDMAQAMGGDLKGAAIQEGKALNDPIKGVTALTRVGVVFTQQQKDQIAAMENAGNMAGAQSIILKELQKEFGGSAEAAGKTFGGQLTILKQRLSDVKQQIGDALMPVLQGMTTWVNDHIMPAIEGFSAFVANKVIPTMQSWGSNISIWVTDRYNALKGFIDKQIAPKLEEFNKYIQSQVVPTLQSWGSNIKTWVTDRYSALKGFIDTQVMPKLSGFWAFINTQIIPVLISWGNNIKVWVIDRYNALKTYIETQLMPGLTKFWNYIMTQIVPILISWGNNIKVWVIDKYTALKTYIETQFMPGLVKLWNYIQTQIVPILQTWGNNIQIYVIDKFNALKDFIVTQVIPALTRLWNYIQNNILPVLASWGSNIGDVQTNIENLKSFIETQVMPVLIILWQWVNDHVVPVFQSLANIIMNDVLPHFSGLATSTGNLIGALGRLWNAISPVLLPVLAFLGWLVGTMLTNALDGLTWVLDNIVGPGIDQFLTGVNNAINVLTTLVGWISTAVEWYNSLADAASNALGIGGGKPATGGGNVGSFASGIENFAGGLAYVHQGEVLTYLPPHSNVIPASNVNLSPLSSFGGGGGTVYIYNIIDGQHLTDNNIGPRVVKSARTNGPLRGGGT